MLGVYYWQSNHIQKSIHYLTLAVDSHQLSNTQTWTTEKMLADLLLNNHQYRYALIHYNRLLQSSKNKKQDVLWLRIAQVYYQLEEWPASLIAVKHYESFHHPDSVTPLTIKLGAQLQLKQFKLAINTVKRIIPLDRNNRNWWMQLVSISLQINQQNLALNTLELARLNHVPLTTKDHVLLAQLYSSRGIPEQAARILSQVRGVKQNRKLIVNLAGYWQRAKEWEKARISWKNAAKLDKKYLWNVAQIEVQQRHYKNAYATLQRLGNHYAKEKIVLEKVRILYKLNKLASALKLAKQAHKWHPSKETQNWVKYLTQLKHYQKTMINS